MGHFLGFSSGRCYGYGGGLATSRPNGRLLPGSPWFFAGVGLFCLVVAMEEISWGQRILGYRPPVYFLQHNFQQELNVHNLPSQELRLLALKAVILGYGVPLPLGGLLTGPRGPLSRVGISPPSPWLAPSFLIIYITYEAYPWDFSGEIVELALGVAFLLALLPATRPRELRRKRTGQQLLPPVAAWGIVVVLGASTPALTRSLKRVNPASVETARGELEALSLDFETMFHLGRVRPTSCGLNERLYTCLVEFNQNYLREGAEVPPVSWTPNPLGEWRTRCQEQDELIHPSFASR